VGVVLLVPHLYDALILQLAQSAADILRRVIGVLRHDALKFA